MEVNWISAKKNPPAEGGRYWCFCEEVGDLGKSYFQWNCSYDPDTNTWQDQFKSITVTHWVPLLPKPIED